MKAFILGALLSLATLAGQAATASNWALESRRIDFLIASVANLNAKFVRGSREYDGPRAAEHLRQKLNYALKNYSSSQEPDFTAEDFIERVASRSHLTGSTYLIKFPNGEIITAHDWLYLQLTYFQP